MRTLIIKKKFKRKQEENKRKTKDNLCAHVHKLNATLKLRIDIDQIDSNSNFALVYQLNPGVIS